MTRSNHKATPSDEALSISEVLLKHFERHGYGDDTFINETVGFTVGDLRALLGAARPSVTSTADELRAALRRTLYIGETIDGHPIAEKRTYTLQLRFETSGEMRGAADAIRCLQSAESNRSIFIEPQ